MSSFPFDALIAKFVYTFSNSFPKGSGSAGEEAGDGDGGSGGRLLGESWDVEKLSPGDKLGVAPDVEGVDCVKNRGKAPVENLGIFDVVELGVVRDLPSKRLSLAMKFELGDDDVGNLGVVPVVGVVGNLSSKRLFAGVSLGILENNGGLIYGVLGISFLGSSFFSSALCTNSFKGSVIDLNLFWRCSSVSLRPCLKSRYFLLTACLALMIACSTSIMECIHRHGP